MEKIQCYGKEIEYEINRGKRKNAYLTIKEGKVILKIPLFVKEKEIQQILQDKKEWIYQKILQSEETLKKQKQYVQGEKYSILGKPYLLEITVETVKKANFKLEESFLRAILPKGKTIEEQKEILKRGIEKLYKTVAEKILPIEIKKVEDRVGLTPKAYRFRKLKRAWGSCSSKKIITFNVDLIQFSEEVIQYVILHELCHLRYMNHSKNFWNMVETYEKRYKEYRKELKKG